MRRHGGGTEDAGGFALVELIAGAVVSIIALTAIVTLSLQHAKLRRVDKELSLAITACRNQLEAVRAMPIDQVPALNGTSFDVPGGAGQPHGLQPLPGDPDGLPGMLVVTVDKSSGSNVLYRVTARVDWKGVLDARSFELTTLVGARK